MNKWAKYAIGFFGSGALFVTTQMAADYPTWGQVLSYANLAIGASLSVLIGWPPKEITPEV